MKTTVNRDVYLTNYVQIYNVIKLSGLEIWNNQSFGTTIANSKNKLKCGTSL